MKGYLEAGDIGKLYRCVPLLLVNNILNRFSFRPGLSVQNLPKATSIASTWQVR